MSAFSPLGTARNLPFVAVAVVLFIGYTAQLAGPLRVVDDGPLFLSGAWEIASGNEYREPRMPRGYPQALSALALAGLNSNAGIVGLNLLSMVGGCALIFVVLHSQLDLSKRCSAMCAVLPCFSWLWVYLEPVPMSDLLFFFLCAATLAALSQAAEYGQARPALILLAAILSVCAFFVRTIGVALFAAVAFASLEQIARRVGRKAAIAAILLVVIPAGLAAIVFEKSLFTAGYVETWRETRQSTPASAIAWWRMGELGEVFENVSARAFVPKANSLPIESVSASELITAELQMSSRLLGIAAMALVAFGAVRRKRFSFVEAFLASYVLVLAVWPFNDPRFWAPVVPLLFAYGWLGLKSLAGVKAAVVAKLYCIVFCLFGVTAMAHSLDASFIHRSATVRQSFAFMSRTAEWLNVYKQFGGEVPTPMAIYSRPLRKTP